MHKVRLVALAAGVSLAVAITLPSLHATAPAGARGQQSQTAHGQRPSREVRAILHDVDPRAIEGSIRTLAGFGTRHTLSSQTDPQRGIGAARDWIYGQLQQSAAASEGRMTVVKQSFV